MKGVQPHLDAIDSRESEGDAVYRSSRGGPQHDRHRGLHTAIGLGTLSGGWRIVKTMGSKIDSDPREGSAYARRVLRTTYDAQEQAWLISG